MRAFAEALPGIPLLANMTEFGRSPRLTGAELQSLGYRMVIWPVSSLRVANKAQKTLYATLRDHDCTDSALSAMQTRQELYDTLSYFAFEDLDNGICRSVLP